MASRTTVTETATRTTSGKFKCKVADNQTLVERIAGKRDQVGPGNHYATTLKRAMSGLCQHPSAVSSYKQALAVKGIGHGIAHLLFPHDSDDGDATAAATAPPPGQLPPPRPAAAAHSKRAAAVARAQQLSQPSPTLLSQCSSASSPVAVAAAATASSTNKAATKKQKRLQQQALFAATAVPVVVVPNTNAAAGPKKPPPPSSSAATSILPPLSLSNKERAYQVAQERANDFKNQHYHWRVVLLVDQRERQSSHVVAKLQMAGIPAREATLPIGDMLWIAEGYQPHNISKSGTSNNADMENDDHVDDKSIKARICLGTILERKSVSDLKASLFGTRYKEQQLRLQHSGLPQVLFLIEGDLNKGNEQYQDTLHSAVWAIRLHFHFQVVHTDHLDDTVLTLKRMHRRILQRHFPSAFFREALPSFVHAVAPQRSTTSSAAGRADLSNVRWRSIDGAAVTTTTSSPEDDKDQQHLRRHRRQHLQSLMELTFDTDPVPMNGQTRFVSYAELKAQVERDREAGQRTVGHLHSHMLKQVWTWSDKKVNALVRAYPTAQALYYAYQCLSVHADADAQKTLVADVALHHDDNGDDSGSRKRPTTARNMTIGPRSAVELFVAYGMFATNSNAPAQTAATASRGALSYTELVAKARQEQAESQESNDDTKLPAAPNSAKDSKKAQPRPRPPPLPPRLPAQARDVCDLMSPSSADNDDESDADERILSPVKDPERWKRKVAGSSSSVDENSDANIMAHADKRAVVIKKQRRGPPNPAEQDVIELDLDD